MGKGKKKSSKVQNVVGTIGGVEPIPNTSSATQLHTVAEDLCFSLASISLQPSQVKQQKSEAKDKLPSPGPQQTGPKGQPPGPGSQQTGPKGQPPGPGPQQTGPKGQPPGPWPQQTGPKGQPPGPGPQQTGPKGQPSGPQQTVPKVQPPGPGPQQTGPKGQPPGPGPQQTGPKGQPPAPGPQQTGPKGQPPGPGPQQTGPKGQTPGPGPQQTGPKGQPPGPGPQQTGPKGQPPGPGPQQTGPKGQPPGPGPQQTGPKGQPPGPGPQQTVPKVQPPGPGPQQTGPIGQPPQAGTGIQIPIRGKAGNKTGRKIIVETNFLQLLVASKQNGVHYDVTIEPDRPKNLMVHVMQKFMHKYFPGRAPAFDGVKNLYSHGPLPFPSAGYTGTVEMELEGRPKPMSFSVSLQWAANIDFSSLQTYMTKGSSQAPPQSTISCLDVVLRTSPLLRFIKVGRSFFSPPAGSVVRLGGGQEMWYGVFQSAVLGWKPFVNVDIAHKGFPKRQSVVELIRELSGQDVPSGPLHVSVIKQLKDFLKSLKVEYEIPGNSASRRTYRVNDVVKPPGEISFTLEDGSRRTVTQYFERDRNYRIKYPQLPCLWVGSLSGPIRICYPVELCTVVPGQVLVRRLDPQQTSNMIRASACPADERKRKIMAAIDSMKYNVDPILKEFGVKVSEKFERVEGRVIPPPALQYEGKTVEPRFGQWFSGKFQNAAKLTQWNIVYLERLNGRELDGLVDALMQMAPRVGMEVARPLRMTEAQLRDLPEILSEAARNRLQLVMVVVGDRGDHYAKVKQEAEQKYGVLTQCVRRSTVQRMKDTTASQLLLKINSKLNSQSHSLAAGPTKPPCLAKPCMIVGADVTHPAPGQDEPSLAAVVASHCPRAFKYNITIRLQPSKVEIISDMEAMIREQLIYFRKVTNKVPVQIIMFRDGVSEGQFSTVLNSELMAIRGACRSLSDTYKPKISYFVVQKRHHTRFFATDPRDADKNQNVPVGTCVDSVITHPTEMDFFLLSHASIKGTARPTRYHRLWDDADMSEAEVEELAFALCHLYTRCTRSVSLPAPTYYAHLAAARAKVYTQGKLWNSGSGAEEQSLIQVTDAVRKDRPMYFV